MELRVLGSNSSGNAYLMVDSTGKMLMVECGIRWNILQKGLNFRTRDVVGCIISHEHKDHCMAAQSVAAAGIDVYASAGTLSALGFTSHRLKTIKAGAIQDIAPFQVLPFNVQHDAREPLGFLIRHDEMGTTLFLTDSYYSKYRFPGLTNVIIEANYDEAIMERKFIDGRLNGHVRNRVMESHMSIDTTLDLLAANDLSRVNNIVLIHLSDSNSHAEEFRQRVANQTGKRVTIAESGISINLSKTPF